MTTISVSDYVWRKLKAIKEKEGHTSFDSVIRTLLTKEEESANR